MNSQFLVDRMYDLQIANICIHSSSWWIGSLSQEHYSRYVAGIIPRMGCQFHTQSIFHLYLRVANSPTCMIWGGERKHDNPEETHKLGHAKLCTNNNTSWALKQGLWSCELPVAPPCWQNQCNWVFILILVGSMCNICSSGPPEAQKFMQDIRLSIFFWQISVIGESCINWWGERNKSIPYSKRAAPMTLLLDSCLWMTVPSLGSRLATYQWWSRSVEGCTTWQRHIFTLPIHHWS